MGRGAPNKKDLAYFPKMVDFYEDDKIFDLLDRYGPLGVTVYSASYTNTDTTQRSPWISYRE